MDNAILTVFHDTHMVDRTIGTPVKKDDVTCYRLIGVGLPLSLCHKPVYTIGAYGKLRYNSSLDITALIGTP